MIKVALIQEEGVLSNKMLAFISKQPELDLFFSSNKPESLLEKISSGPLPDVILFDSSLGGKNSLDILPMIKGSMPAAKIIVTTTHLSTDQVLEALNKGADSYYIHSSEIRELLNAIHVTMAGGAYLDPMAAKVLVGFFRKISSGKPQSFQFSLEYWSGKGTFVARELQVIKGLLNNLSYKEIASNHNVGINTVRYYVKSVYRKLNINSRSQLWEIFSSPVMSK